MGNDNGSEECNNSSRREGNRNHFTGKNIEIILNNNELQLNQKEKRKKTDFLSIKRKKEFQE